MSHDEQIAEILREADAYLIKEEVIRLASIFRENDEDMSEVYSYELAFEIIQESNESV
jgi:hypothetical protein